MLIKMRGAEKEEEIKFGRGVVLGACLTFMVNAHTDARRRRRRRRSNSAEGLFSQPPCLACRVGHLRVAAQAECESRV
jgi:hypothetical protein